MPKLIHDNNDLPFLNETEKNNLIKATGIKTRRIALKTTTAADLCLHSAKSILENLQWDPNTVDVLVFVTQTPDYTIPGNSMMIQHKLGLSKTCLCFDVNQGCAGYVYGMSIISSLMSTGKLKRGLLLVGDTITRTLFDNDPATIPIFSDAGSATAFAFDENSTSTHYHLQTDGSGYDKIIIQNGGARKPTSNSSSKESCLYMNGQDIFAFGLKEVGKNINELLAHCSINASEIDYLVMHQANLLLNESIRKMTGIPTEKTLYSLHDYGNTSCASIPVTLAANASALLSNNRNKILLSGFGVGLSWGSCITSLIDCNLIKMDTYHE